MSEEMYLFVLGWIVKVCGGLVVVGMAIFGPLWVWHKALVGMRLFPLLLYLSAFKMHGAKLNRELLWAALKVHVGDSDTAARIVIDYVKRLRPECEKDETP